MEENTPTGRRYFKIEAFKSRVAMDPETIAGELKAVTQAISEFYAQGKTSMAFEDLYRGAYNLVLHGKAEDLCSAVEATVTSEVQSLFRPLEAAPADGGAAAFLKELLAKWNQHTRAVNFTRDILMYMDRIYVPTKRKTPIYELGLRLWRENMAGSDKIRERLGEAVRKLKGGGEEDELVAGVNKMLTELGADVPGLLFPDGEAGEGEPHQDTD